MWQTFVTKRISFKLIFNKRIRNHLGNFFYPNSIKEMFTNTTNHSRKFWPKYHHSWTFLLNITKRQSFVAIFTKRLSFKEIFTKRQSFMVILKKRLSFMDNIHLCEKTIIRGNLYQKKLFKVINLFFGNTKILIFGSKQKAAVLYHLYKLQFLSQIPNLSLFKVSPESGTPCFLIPPSPSPHSCFRIFRHLCLPFVFRPCSTTLFYMDNKFKI